MGYSMTFEPSVRRTNLDSSVLYLKGQEDIDGSICFRVDDKGVAGRIELRTSGTWKMTGFGAETNKIIKNDAGIVLKNDGGFVLTNF